MTTTYEFRFAGSAEWFKSPMATEAATAFHAMRLHGGRIVRCVPKGGGCYAPSAPKSPAGTVYVRVRAEAQS